MNVLILNTFVEQIKLDNTFYHESTHVLRILHIDGCFCKHIYHRNKMADYRLVEVKDLGGEAIETMMDIDGLRLTTFTKPPEVTANLVHNIKNMELRDDDVMLCTAVKSGTACFCYCVCQKVHFVLTVGNGDGPSVGF